MSLHHLPVQQSAYFAVQEPDFPQETAPDLLLALHGYGQMAEKFLATFGRLRNRNLLIIAPQAPHQFYVKLQPKIVGCTWLTQFERDRSIEEFLGHMTTLFEHVQNQLRFAPRRVVVLGFSQGVSMAYRLLCSQRLPLAGLIACGGDLPPDVLDNLSAVNHTPILLAHGNDDSIVPRREADNAEKILQAKGFVVDKYVFPGGHAIPYFVSDKIIEWMKGQAGSNK